MIEIPEKQSTNTTQEICEEPFYVFGQGRGLTVVPFSVLLFILIWKFWGLNLASISSLVLLICIFGVITYFIYRVSYTSFRKSQNIRISSNTISFPGSIPFTRSTVSLSDIQGITLEKNSKQDKGFRDADAQRLKFFYYLLGPFMPTRLLCPKQKLILMGIEQKWLGDIQLKYFSQEARKKIISLLQQKVH